MRFIGSVIIAVIIVIIGLSIYLQPNDFSSCSVKNRPTGAKDCRQVDAVIAVSGGDTMARTKHAVMLYENGWARMIIFSGAAQDTSGPSNALVMRQSAIKAGVPAKAILIEEHSQNTRQNAENTDLLLKDHDIKSVILTTSGYHQRRASLEFHKLLSNDITIQNNPTNDKDWNAWWWVTPRGWWLASGEFVKIIAFYIGVSS